MQIMREIKAFIIKVIYGKPQLIISLKRGGIEGESCPGAIRRFLIK